MHLSVKLASLCALFAASVSAQAEPLVSRWASQVNADNVHPEHPRPSLRRSTWQSLNGEWDYAIVAREEQRPASWDGTILVPFPVESHLSGVARRVSVDQRVWYRRTFVVPADWNDRRVIVRFGAVDWRADVWIDGEWVGEHEGGFDPFAFDVTHLAQVGGEHRIVVAAWDPTDVGHQPRGKQVREPHGIWYTPTTGIWQSVWLEGVPRTSVERVAVTEIGATRVRVAPEVLRRNGHQVEVRVSSGGREVARGSTDGESIELEVGTVRRWSPDDPALYDLRVRVLDGGDVVDEIETYFAIRTIECKPDASGIPRLFLNGEPLFQIGLLDQGFWPGGLYTAPTDEALRYDLEVTKQLGFNMVRKHVKVEPERWYHHCDRLGLLVWQDIPSGGPYIGPADPDAERTPQSAENFERETRRIVDAFSHHPSIVSWVLFNEGWGQYDTGRLTAWLMGHDPTRLVNAASGWTDRGVGHVFDVHRYPGPAMPPVEAERAAVLGEFGGLGLPLAGHTWQDEKNWGYRSYASKTELNDAYLALVAQLPPLIAQGLSAAVYTQTTDVEIEVNGVMTYDHAVLKLDDPRIPAANRRLLLPPPEIVGVVPTSRGDARTWRYREQEPPRGWEQPGFDDGEWQVGSGGFGTEGTPGAVVGTVWSSDAIWLRRTFELDAPVPEGELALHIHHDEDVEVYLNGHRIAALSGYTTGYVFVPLRGEDRERIIAGENTIAVHCRQTGGGQFIDAGLSVLRQRD